MELKQFQNKVIKDLIDYLYFYNMYENSSKAFDEFWLNKGVLVGYNGIKKYQENKLYAPQVCIKVPTGGGKTFIASASIKPIFNSLPSDTRAVIWLVPSDTILSQTIENLKNPNHPYRQKLNSDFSSKIEVYTKTEALNGQNFNTTTINEQLSIFVMSFDSFRIENKEGRKVYKENSNLYGFSKENEALNAFTEKADDLSLMQVFNSLNPVVIVDESHNAKSVLSLEMLSNLNPSFVLELTATPRGKSNVISYVDAIQLKREHMVKLPVLVYNRPTQKQVILDAIDLRNQLENYANNSEQITGKYIRPIVLFQAQPKTRDDNTTFETLKNKLIEIGLPKEEIAIKTASVNELKNNDLMSNECNIRYIITVNALKEGWDCPSAYILASLANRTSTVDVEQIVGRILRQPYTQKFTEDLLNMSYVLTSSSDFNTTLEKVLKGLNSAGFSKRDYRAYNLNQEEKDKKEDGKSRDSFYIKESQEGFDFLPSEMKDEVELLSKNTNHESVSNQIIQEAKVLNEYYEYKAKESNFGGLFGAERDMLNVVNVKKEFKPLVNELKFPQFVINLEVNIFGETKALVSKDYLLEDFMLQDKPIPTSLTETIDQVIKIDIENTNLEDVRLTTARFNKRELKAFKQKLSQTSDERIRTVLINTIYNQVERMNNVATSQLKDYIKRIINSYKIDEIYSIRDNIFSVAGKIKSHIESLKDEHAFNSFVNKVEKGVIKISEEYQVPPSIAPVKSGLFISKTFYEEEARDMNNTETEIIRIIAGLDNIKCWHRILERKQNEFFINGFTNHYPDFWILTKNHNLILLEVKGEHLADITTKRKAKLGKMWQNKSGDGFSYFMVFKEKDMNYEGAYKLNDFLDIVKTL